jgi:hypothetical protein
MPSTTLNAKERIAPAGRRVKLWFRISKRDKEDGQNEGNGFHWEPPKIVLPGVFRPRGGFD